MNGLRRLASLPLLRRVLLQPTVRRCLARVLSARFLVAAFVTTEPLRLLRGELLDRGRMRSYVIRRTGRVVTLRHGRDLEALFELFWRGEYEPPAALANRLRLTQPTVLDLGANVGMFTAWALGRWPGAHVVAVEPAPENLPELREALRRNVGEVEVIEAAASTEAGTLVFNQGRGGGSALADDPSEGVTVPAIDIFDHLAAADFVKMDIEGGEWPILADPRLAELRHVTLVMEYHRVGAPHLPARTAAAELLAAAGFSTGFGAANHWGHGTLWAWKD